MVIKTIETMFYSIANFVKSFFSRKDVQEFMKELLIKKVEQIVDLIFKQSDPKNQEI